MHTVHHDASQYVVIPPPSLRRSRSNTSTEYSLPGANSFTAIFTLSLNSLSLSVGNEPAWPFFLFTSIRICECKNPNIREIER